MNKIIFVIVLSMLLGCQASFNPKTVSSNDDSFVKPLLFKSSLEKTISNSKSIFSKMNWKLLYEGKNLPDRSYGNWNNRNVLIGIFHSHDHDRIVWDDLLSPDSVPVYYMQVKTPTTLTSYGAQIFLALYETKNNDIVLAISASSNQVRERNKLKSYIETFSDDLILLDKNSE